MSLAISIQLAQIRPGVVTALSAYLASLLTETTLIIVCNTSVGAADYSIFHDDDGNTFDDTTALYRNITLAAKTTARIELSSPGAGISVSPTGNIGVQSSVANALTFTLYGTTASLTGV